MPKSAWLILSLSLLSCGYQWQSVSSSPPTVAISFTKEDREGLFAQELMKALALSKVARPTTREGDYRMQVRFVKEEEAPIGYRFAREKISGEESQNLVLSENRKEITVEVTLFKGSEDQAVLGPFEVSSSSDYDFLAGDSFQDLSFVDPQGNLQRTLPFSLGQLEPKEAASDASQQPLFQELARKIVDALVAKW